MAEENTQGAEAQNIPQENTTSPQHNPAEFRGELYKSLQADGILPADLSMDDFNTKLSNPVFATQLYDSLQTDGIIPQDLTELDFIGKATIDFRDIDNDAFNVMQDYEDQLSELDTQIANIGKSDDDYVADFSATKNEFGGPTRSGDIKKKKESDLKLERAALELERSAKLAELNVTQNLDGSPTIHGMQSQGKQLYAEAGEYYHDLQKQLLEQPYTTNFLGEPTYENPEEVARLREQMNQVNITRRALSEVVNSTLTPESFAGVKDGFTAAVRDKNFELLPFVGDAIAISQNLEKSGAVNRLKEAMDAGESYDDALSMLDKEDQFLIKSTLLSTNFGAETSGLKDTWFNAGAGFAETLPFLVELGATGGVKAGVSKAIQKKVGGEFAEKLAKREAIKAGAGTATEKIAKLKSAELALTTGEKAWAATANIAGLSVQAAALPNEVFKNATERMSPEMISAYGPAGEAIVEQIIDGENSTEALMKGYGLTWSELFTEQVVGKWVDDIALRTTSVGSKGFAKAKPHVQKQLKGFFNKPENVMSNALGRYAVKAGKKLDDMVLDPVAKTVDGVGINSILGEYVEELANIPLQNAITGDNSLMVGITDGEGNIDYENLRNVFNQTLVSTGALKTPKFASQGIKGASKLATKVNDKAYRRKTQNDFTKVPESDKQIRNKELYALMDLHEAKMDDETFDKEAKKILSQAPAESKEGTKIALEYFRESRETLAAEEKLNNEQKGVLSRVKQARSTEALDELTKEAKGDPTLMKAIQRQQTRLNNENASKETEIKRQRELLRPHYERIAKQQGLDPSEVDNLMEQSIENVRKLYDDFDDYGSDSFKDDFEGEDAFADYGLETDEELSGRKKKKVDIFNTDETKEFAREYQESKRRLNTGGRITGRDADIQVEAFNIVQDLAKAYFNNFGRGQAESYSAATGMSLQDAQQYLAEKASEKSLANDDLSKFKFDKNASLNTYLNGNFSSTASTEMKSALVKSTDIVSAEYDIRAIISPLMGNESLEQSGLTGDNIRELINADPKDVQGIIDRLSEETGKNLTAAKLTPKKVNTLKNYVSKITDKELSDGTIARILGAQSSMTSIDSSVEGESAFDNTAAAYESVKQDYQDHEAELERNIDASRQSTRVNNIIDRLGINPLSMYFEVAQAEGIAQADIMKAINEVYPDATLESLKAEAELGPTQEVSYEAELEIGIDTKTLIQAVNETLGLPSVDSIERTGEVKLRESKKTIKEIKEAQPSAKDRVSEAVGKIQEAFNSPENKAKSKSKQTKTENAVAYAFANLIDFPRTSDFAAYRQLMNAEGKVKVGDPKKMNAKQGAKAAAPKFEQDILPALEGFTPAEILAAIKEIAGKEGWRPELWYKGLKKDLDAKADIKAFANLNFDSDAFQVSFGDQFYRLGDMSEVELNDLQEQMISADLKTQEERLDAIRNIEKVQNVLEARFNNEVPQGTYDIMNDEFGSANYVTLDGALEQARAEAQKNPIPEVQNALNIIESLVPVFGGDFKIHKSTGGVVGGQFVAGNRFDPNTGKVYLSAAESKAVGSNPIVALAHELDHKLHYDSLKVVDALIQNGAPLSAINNSLDLLPEALQAPARELVTKFLDSRKSILPRVAKEIAKERSINPDLDSNPRLRELMAARYALSDIMEFSAGGASANNIRVLQSLELNGEQKGILSRLVEVVKDFRNKLYEAFGIDSTDLGFDVIAKFRESLVDQAVENETEVEVEAPRFLGRKHTAKSKINSIAKQLESIAQGDADVQAAVSELQRRASEFSKSELKKLNKDEQENKINKIDGELKAALKAGDLQKAAQLSIDKRIEQAKLQAAFGSKSTNEVIQDFADNILNKQGSIAEVLAEDAIAQRNAMQLAALMNSKSTRGFGNMETQQIISDAHLKRLERNRKGARKLFYQLKSPLKSLLWQTSNWETMNEAALGSFPQVAELMVDPVKKGRFEYTQMSADQQEFIKTALADFGNGKTATAKSRAYAQEAKNTDVEVKFVDEQGISYQDKISADQASLIYLISKMPNQEMYREWRKQNNISQKTIDDVNKNLPQKFKNVADSMMSRMEQKNAELSQYVAGSGQGPVFGLTSMNPDGTYDDGITDMFSSNAALKALDPKKLKLDGGMMNAVIATEDMTNRFIAFREPLSQIEKVIEDENFKRAFILKNGEDAYKQYTKFFNQIKNGVSRKNNALSKAMDFIFQNAVVSAIGLAPRIFITQVASMPVYFRETRIDRAGKAIGESLFGTGEGKKVRDYILENSGLLKTRGEESYKYFDVNRPAGLDVNTGPFGNFLHWNQKISGALTRTGDRVAILAGGIPFAKIKYDQYIAEGLPEDQALHNALMDFEAETAKAQQSQNIEERSLFQNNQFLKYLNAFKTTPLQYGRISTNYLLKMKNAAQSGDSKAVATNLGRWAMFQLLSQAPYYFIQQGFDFGWDDDEETDWKTRNTLWKMGTSNILNMLPILGDIINAGIEKSAVESPYMKNRGWGDVVVQGMFDKVLAGQATKVQKALNTEDNKFAAIAALAVQSGTGLPIERIAKNWISSSNLLLEGEYGDAADALVHGANYLKYEKDYGYSEAEELKEVETLLDNLGLPTDQLEDLKEALGID